MPHNARVFVIDDDAAMRDSLEFLLGTAGFAVTPFDSAVQFLDALPHLGFGCLVTDIRMPEVDGIELLKRLKTASIKLPVVVMTGHGEVPLAVEAMKRGFTGEADEVAVALFVFSEHEEVVVAAGEFAMIVGLGEVELAAEDRLDVLLLHGVEEVNRAVDVAVVGHGRGGLADLIQVGGELVDVTGSIKERVIRMQMEVGKLGGHSSMLSPH